MSRKITRNDLFATPWNFLAFGFGSGLSPKAPGTAGSVAALPLYWLIADWSIGFYGLVTVLACVLGVVICQKASDWLQVHDHGGIVWDEIAGILITFLWVPFAWHWLVLGFVLFRVFDILKPWPIGWIDRHLEGGLGIMVDDIVAGVFACGCLHLIMAFWG